MAKSSKPNTKGTPADRAPDAECVRLANEVADIAKWLADGTNTPEAEYFGIKTEAIREKLDRALQVLHGLPHDYSDRKTSQRMRAVHLVHQAINGIGCTDAKSLLGEVNGRLYDYRPGWFMKQIEWTPEQIALAQCVLSKWKQAKWDPINNLLTIWDLRHDGKRRGGTKTSGASAALAQDYNEYKNPKPKKPKNKKIGA